MALAHIDITADRRVPYWQQYAFIGFDWAGSSWSAQLRNTKGETGPPLIDFTPGVVLDYSGTATAAAHIAAGRLTSAILGVTNPLTGAKFISTDNVTLSWLRVSLDVDSIAMVPLRDEPEDNAVAWYDVIRHPPTTGDEVVMEGKFIVLPGVTIP